MGHLMRGATAVFVSGLWAAGKSSCLRNLEHEAGKGANFWSIKNYEAAHALRRPRATGIGTSDLRVYYTYIAASFRGVIETEISRNGLTIFEVSPPLLCCFLDLADRAFYLNTPRHKCAERLAMREGWPLKRALRMIEAQWQLTQGRKTFWARVESVGDTQLLRSLRQIIAHQRATVMKSRGRERNPR
jgi:hypothetical protein